LLIVAGGRDTIIPAHHQQLLAERVPAAELVLYPDGSHGVTNRAYESRSLMADWLAARLVP
jgi:pimeloyl-ACP methyl ester carboxylesterase